jgi:hypothetical protein
MRSVRQKIRRNEIGYSGYLMKFNVVQDLTIDLKLYGLF